MEFNSLFVVYDPTQSEQPALERAAAITEQAEAAIHVYACIHEDTAQPMGGSENERQLLDRQKETLNKAVTLLRSRGVSVTTEVEWDKDWYSAVVRASLRTEADLVLKSSYPHSVRERVLKRTSDWTLIRGCHCPVPTRLVERIPCLITRCRRISLPSLHPPTTGMRGPLSRISRMMTI